MKESVDIFASVFQNLVSFVTSLPTTALALIVIALILNMLGVTVKGIIKAIVCSFVISVVLGSFGIVLPSFSQIYSFFVSAFYRIKGFFGF